MNDLGRLEEGGQIHELMKIAYPICRSITGDGVRETLAIVQEAIGDTAEMQIHEVESGTPVLDWEVPREWNVREAWLEGPKGRVLDLAEHNLHLMSYSTPVDLRLPLEELQEHLYSLPEQPEVIPYRTSYYVERWGFCLPHAQREALEPGEYHAYIDSSLEPGSLTYGEVTIPGRSRREVLLSTHVCHPSMCNDNLSGVFTLTMLARLLGSVRNLRYTYRLVFVPGTIGSITWLARNQDAAGRIAHGLVVSNLGDAGKFHYKCTPSSDRPIDGCVVRALGRLGHDVQIEPFSPFGYDERQYCSPGFDLPVGSLTRSPWGRYPEYHTSADDLDFVRPEALAQSLEALLGIVGELETARIYRNVEPFAEPQLGRRGLYSSIGGDDSGREKELALLWVLHQCDGARPLADVAARSGVDPERLEWAVNALTEAGLLAEVDA
ncbi:MAG: DUF4910 domain-containing protein [Acidobacteriota bacterium]